MSTEENTAALRALNEEIKKQNQFANAVSVNGFAVKNMSPTLAERHTAPSSRTEPLTDFFTGTCFGAAVAVLFWTLFGR